MAEKWIQNPFFGHFRPHFGAEARHGSIPGPRDSNPTRNLSSIILKCVNGRIRLGDRLLEVTQHFHSHSHCLGYRVCVCVCVLLAEERSQGNLY